MGPGQKIIDPEQARKAYFQYREHMKRTYPTITIRVNDFIAGWNAAHKKQESRSV